MKKMLVKNYALRLCGGNASTYLIIFVGVGCSGSFCRVWVDVLVPCRAHKVVAYLSNDFVPNVTPYLFLPAILWVLLSLVFGAIP
ncbi:MAG: hypothetical protein IPN94_19750 [Sphingobacteriales bacterium]|nr:hypothetical protein [Sphingobacteriales bacterium]